MTTPFSPFSLRRDRLRRWEDARDQELTAENQTLSQHQHAEQDLLAAFDQPDAPAQPRPLGPTPGGMRPARRPPTTAATPDASAPGDPFQDESQLARDLAWLRYRSAAAPVFGLGQTTAKILRTGYGALGKLPGVGRPFRALEEDLDSRINADEARERLVRERYMSGAERTVQDLARFGLEFETAGRLFPILKATPARGASALARIGGRAATEAAQFGTFEAGKSLASGESIDEAAQHSLEGATAGAAWGGGFGALGEVGPPVLRGVRNILRPFAEGAAAVPGAIREGARNVARDALVADAMVRETAGGVRRRVGEATSNVRRGIAERLSPELAREASTDPLTGAMNRRADQAAGEKILAQREPGTRVIRLRADLDNFKALNDARGHDAGDEALRRVTESWRQAAREGDVIDTPGTARLGGDEFGATLKIGEHADPEAIARRYEQRANQALEEAGLHQAGDKQVGISVGWAEEGQTHGELDAAADQAAAARKKGRGVSQPREAPAGQPEPPSRAPETRPPEEGHRATSGGEIAPPGAAQEAPATEKLTRQQQGDAKATSEALARARQAATGADKPEGMADYLDAMADARHSISRIERNGAAPQTVERLARELEEVGSLVRDKHIEGPGEVEGGLRVSADLMHGNLRHAERLIGEGETAAARSNLDDVRQYLEQGNYFGGEREIAAIRHRLEVLEGKLGQAPTPKPPAEKAPKRKGKKPTPEQLEAAFQRGRSEGALKTLHGVQRAVIESGLRPSAGDVSTIGKKVERGRLRDDVLSLEVRERFGRSLDRPEFGDPEKAPQTLADAVRAMDEQLASSEHKHYDVSRYGDGEITAARLPDPFYEAGWKEGAVPTPGDLRSMVGFGKPVDQTLRRLESGSAQAARDAEVLEHLGGKNLAGVARARQIATDLANQKVSLEQQVERAIARSEEVHSEGARGKAAALNRDISKAKIKPGDWLGNSMAEGEWVSDGHIMFKRSDVDLLPAKKVGFYLKESTTRKGLAQESAAKLFQGEVEAAKTKLEVLGHLPIGEDQKFASAYLVPEGENTGMRRVNAALLRRLHEITRFDELRGRTGKGATDRSIAAYRDGEPVGLIMPIRMEDAPPFSVAEARELAGKPIEPPRSSGTTDVKGLRVREPLTARTPMEPNYEQPLASQSLPAAAQPSMTTPAQKPDIPAARARIVRKMSEILNIPVRVGKYAGFRSGTLGIYKIRPEVVRLKIAKDIEVLGHEVGHHLHKLFFGTAPSGGLSSNVLRPWWAELKPLAKGISDQTSSEGLAEFFRRFLTNPKEAETAAPKFFEYVTMRLADDFPEVRAMFDDARAAYKVYIDAGPEARLASNISSEPTRNWSFGDKFRRFLTDIVDDQSDVVRAQQEIVSSSLGLDAPPWWRPIARAKWMGEVSRQTRWEENAASLARLVRGSAGTAEHFIKRGTLEWGTLQTKGKSLEAILRPVSKQFDEFLNYSVARRAMELHGRGKETGILADDAVAVADKYIDRKHFVRAFDDLQVYQQHLLEWLRGAGVISSATLERILAKNESYLPFYRVLDEETARRVGSGSVFGRLFNPVKRIKGSGRDIINPFESIIKNTYLYTRLAARQRVSVALSRLAEREGAGVWIERLSTPTATTKFSFGEIQKQLEGILGDRLDLEGMSEKQQAALAEEMLAVYRPGDFFGKDNIISVLKGDKRVWYEVDPDLYKSMMALNHEQSGMVTRLLTFPAKALRIGATLAPEFIGRNPIRDQIAAFVQSDYGFKPGFDWGRGLFHMLKRDDLFWKWKAAGGERASLLELDRDSLRKSVRDVLGHAQEPVEILKDVIKSPIELLKLLSAAAEDATRIGEFARGVEQEGTSRAGLEKSAAASREVSVDFARHGAKTEAIRLVTAFWNARIQGYTRLVRAMREHPVRTSARAGVAITLPSVLLFYANKDDPDYWAKPQWERDLFWHVKLRDTWYRIPKPFELGIIFGTIPEHILEWAHTHDPKGLQHALTQTMGSDLASLIPIPTTLVPLIENFANWSLFRRQPIVSRPLEDVRPEFQFTEGTSEIAKGLGRMVGYSPAKIDNLMFGWGGGLGRMAVDVGDIGGRQTGLFPDEPRPSKTAADIPGVRGFISKPAGRSSEDVERFYAEWSSVREAKSTRDLLDREDRLDERDRFEDENADALDRYSELKSYADDLSGLRHEIEEISRDESLSGDEKRRQMDELGREMQQIAADAIERRTPANTRRP